MNIFYEKLKANRALHLEVNMQFSDPQWHDILVPLASTLKNGLTLRLFLSHPCIASVSAFQSWRSKSSFPIWMKVYSLSQPEP